MKHIGSLFGDFGFQDKGKIKSERALVLSDIISLANGSPGIKKKLTPRNAAVFLSPYTVSELYGLLSKMKQAKNPAALFWWHVKK